MKIQRAKETMTAKERVRRTFAFEKTDRVTIGYEANAGIHRRLAQALGIPDGNPELVNQALGVDYRRADAVYHGPLLYPERPGCQLDPVFGCYTRWVEHSSGGYWDYCDFPLQDAEDEEIAAFPIPSPDDFDYDIVGQQLAQYKDSAVCLGSPGYCDIINTSSFVFGVEDTLVHLSTENEAAMDYIDRKLDMRLGILERILHKYPGRFDFIWSGEDLGSQRGPLISLDLYRRVLKPRHKRVADLAKAYNLPLLMHTCGSSSWVYEDFIDIGVSAVDTLQPEAADMSPRYLKERFGRRLNFRGCISTAGPLSYGTAEETVQTVRDTLAIMMPGGGYHFAPTHDIQDNSPVENVLAMYQAAHDYGVYQP